MPESQAAELMRNFTDAEAFATSMVSQLRLAGQLQRDFLPKFLPHIKGLHWSVVFRPAEIVSGDIYDVARIDERHIGFYVADVVGHGMPAALLTIFLKHSIVMRQTIGNTYQIFTPAEVLQNLNQKMYEQGLSGSQFATCCYCLLNIETMELTCARGGHPYPILLKDGGRPQQLCIQGPLLGIFKDASFEQQTIALTKKDKLLLYSDGAEGMIGKFKGSRDFVFTPDFEKISSLPLVEINERFNQLIDGKVTNPAEVDDITIVGLGIE